MRFTVYNYPDYYMTVETGGSVEEVMKVKRLPDREYNPTGNCWVIPIRPGLADILSDLYGPTLAEPVRAIEAGFLLLIEPPPAGSVRMNEVSARQAVELATLYTLFHKFKGDRAEYAKQYAPYKRGE